MKIKNEHLEAECFRGHA